MDTGAGSRDAAPGVHPASPLGEPGHASHHWRMFVHPLLVSESINVPSIQSSIVPTIRRFPTEWMSALAIRSPFRAGRRNLIDSSLVTAIASMPMAVKHPNNNAVSAAVNIDGPLM